MLSKQKMLQHKEMKQILDIENKKDIEAFIKELGIKPEPTDKKLSIKAKDLPSEETKVFVLEKAV